jgi:hypothetical protein
LVQSSGTPTCQSSKITLNLSLDISESRWGGSGIDDTAAFMKFAELGSLGSTKPFPTTSKPDVAANKSAPLVSIKQPSVVELPKNSVNSVPNNITLATFNSVVVTPSSIEPVIGAQVNTALPVVVEERILQQTSPHIQAVTHSIKKKEVGLAGSRWAAPDPLSILQPGGTAERYELPIQGEYVGEVSIRQNTAPNAVVSSEVTSGSAVQSSYQQTTRFEHDEQFAVQPVSLPSLEGNKSTFSELTSTMDDGSIGDLIFFTGDEEPSTVDDGSIGDLIFLAGDEEPEPLSNGISLSVMQDLSEIYDDNMTMEPRPLKSIGLIPDTKEDVSNFMQPKATEVPRESRGKQIPSNSEYERLAKCHEEFHLDWSPTTLPATAVATAIEVNVTPEHIRDAPKTCLLKGAILSTSMSTTTDSMSSLPVTATCLEATDVQLLEGQKALSTMVPSAYSEPLLLSSDDKGPPGDSANGKFTKGVFTPTTSRLFESSDNQSDPCYTELTEIGGVSLNESASPPVARSGIYSNIFTASNTDLKGAPGLSSSRWSDLA